MLKRSFSSPVSTSRSTRATRPRSLRPQPCAPKPAKRVLANQETGSRKRPSKSPGIPTGTSPAWYLHSDGRASVSVRRVSSTEIDWAFPANQGYNRGQYHFLSGVAGNESNALRFFTKKKMQPHAEILCLPVREKCNQPRRLSRGEIMSDMGIQPAAESVPGLSQLQRVTSTFSAPSKTFEDIKRGNKSW